MANSHSFRINHDTAAYWQGASQKELVLARCQDCRHWIHPPRACCPECWSDAITHESPSGKATLYSYTVQSGGPGRPPLILGWAELDEQKRLMVVGPISAATPETIEIGSRLSLEWIEVENTHIPAFRQEQPE